MNIPNPLPKGTTQEQWDVYELQMKEHNKHCASIKRDYEIIEWLIKENSRMPVEWLKERMWSEYDKIRFMDAPNHPGYTHANND